MIKLDKSGSYRHSNGWWYTVYYNRTCYGTKWELYKGQYSGHLHDIIDRYWTKKEAVSHIPEEKLL